MTDWRIYTGDGAPKPDSLATRPDAPEWRQFERLGATRASTFRPPGGVIEAINAALYLRRPLLVTGDPGTGKSSLAYAVANELGLGPVLSWNINSRSTLTQGLYEYDSLARLRRANLDWLRARGSPATMATILSESPDVQPALENIGQYITLGAIGTAFVAPASRPRVVLIDEIDKSDVDLPNDLLHVFENGRFEIRELARIENESSDVVVRTLDRQSVTIHAGQVRCTEFPVVVITSNGERDLPPAFLRRCLRVDLPRPTPALLREIVLRHLPGIETSLMDDLIDRFERKRDQGGLLATDQLLNAFYLVTQGRSMTSADRAAIESIVLRELETV